MKLSTLAKKVTNDYESITIFQLEDDLFKVKLITDYGRKKKFKRYKKMNVDIKPNEYVSRLYENMNMVSINATHYYYFKLADKRYVNLYLFNKLNLK